MNKLRIALTFYSSFFIASSLITLACLISLDKDGLEALTPWLFLKIFSAAAIIFFINTFKRNEFYYYQNLGLSKTSLWLITMGIDMTIFSLAIVTLILLR